MRYLAHHLVVGVALLVLLGGFSVQVHAGIIARLDVDQIVDIGRVGTSYSYTSDEDDWGETSDDSEPFWHLAIFDYYPDPNDPLATGNSERLTDESCATWFPATTLDISDGLELPIERGTEAYFYIAVYDYDTGWTDYYYDGTTESLAESLGDHFWTGAVDYRTSGQWNNDLAPGLFGAAGGGWCDLGVTEWAGGSENWYGYFWSRYLDNTPPAAATRLDFEGLGSVESGAVNADGTIQFTWSQGSDEDTGVRQLIRVQRQSDSAICEKWLDDTFSQFEFRQSAVMTCDTPESPPTLALDELDAYRAIVGTENGIIDDPVIANPTLVFPMDGAELAWTGWIRQDSQDPSATFTAPSASAWYGGDLSVTVEDSLNATTCEYRVNGGAWRSRTCGDPGLGASFGVTVGPDQDCLTPGAGQCVVELQTTSWNGRSLVPAPSQAFSVDWLEDDVGTLKAFADAEASSDQGNAFIEEGWYADSTPYYVWTSDPSAHAPTEGYAIGRGTNPADCSIVQTSPYFQVTSADPCQEGPNAFNVRVLDEAGNCGQITSFVLNVDTQKDAITSLEVRDGRGTVLPLTTWQAEDRPVFVWTADNSSGNVLEFKYLLDDASLGADPTCSATTDTEATSYRPDSGQGTGKYLFSVRAVDEAGNCGDPYTYPAEVWIDVTDPDDVAGLTITANGSTIANGDFTNDTTPSFSWNVVPVSDGASAIGYAFDMDLSNWELLRDATTQPEPSYTIGEIDALAEGEHTFGVIASDAVGNDSASVTTVTFSVDTTDPVLADAQVFRSSSQSADEEITDGWDWDDQPFVTWTLADTGLGSPVAYSLRLDPPSGAAPSCVPQQSTNTYDFEALGEELTEGPHTFEIWPVDEAGNCGTAMAVDLGVDWTGDAISSVRAFASEGGTELSGAGPHNIESPYFTWSTSGAIAPNKGFFVDLRSAGEPAPSPSCGVTDYSRSAAEYGVLTTLAEDTWTLYLAALDEAGNCSPELETFTFTVDRTAPAISSVAVYDNADDMNVLSAWTQVQSPFVDWSLDAPDEAGFSFSVAIDGIPADAACQTLLTDSHLDFSDAGIVLSDGRHTVDVWATDPAGNCDVTPVTAHISVDSTADPLTISAYTTNPAEGGSEFDDGAPQISTQPYFSWILESPGVHDRADVVDYFVRLTELGESAPSGCDPANTWAAGIGSDFYEVPADTLTPGTYWFHVSTLDEAGNCSVANFQLVLVTPPAISNVTVTPNRARDIPAEEPPVTISFEVSRLVSAENPVVRVGSRLADYSADSGRISFTYTFRPRDGTDPEGPVPVTISLVDELGYSADVTESDGISLILDFTPPDLNELVIAPEIATSGQDVTFTVTPSEALLSATILSIGSDAVDFDLSNSGGGSWTSSRQFLSTVGDGLKDVDVELVDLAGNARTFSDAGDFTLDFTDPTVALLFPVYREVLNLGDEIAIEWTTTDAHPATVDIHLSRDGGETFEDIVEDAADTGTFNWTVVGAPTNDARVRVTATDAVGHTGVPATSLMGFRIREATPDHIILTTDAPTATVSQPVSISVEVVDALSDPVGVELQVTVSIDGDGELVSSTLGGHLVDGQSVSGTTDENGRATVVVTSRTAEVVTISGGGASLPAVADHVDTSITFVPSTADHLIAYSDDAEAPLGGVEPIVLQVVDREGNAVIGAVPLSVQVSGDAVIVDANLQAVAGLGTAEVTGSTLANGEGAVDVLDFTPEIVTVVPVSASELLGLEMPHEATAVTFIETGVVHAVYSRVWAEPERVFANGEAISTITVEPLDSAEERVGTGLSVGVHSSYGQLDEVVDNEDGTYSTSIRSAMCQSEPAVVRAEVEGIQLQEIAEVDFTCDEMVGAVLVADPGRIAGDGVRCSTLTVLPLGHDALPMASGQAVQFFPSFGTVSGIREDGFGLTYAEFCSSECNESVAAIIDVSVNGVPLTDLSEELAFEIVVVCIYADAALSTLTVAPGEIVADGEAAATVTVTPIDVLGDVMGMGLAVAVETTLGELTATEDVGDGTYRALLTSTEPGAAIISASVNGIVLEQTASLLLNPAQPEYRGSDALTIDQELLGGDLIPGGNAVMTARIRSNTDFDIDDVSISLDLDAGLSLKPDSLRFNDEAITAEPDGDDYVIAVGQVPALQGQDDTDPLVLRYEVEIEDDAEGAPIVSLQAFMAGDPRPISESSRVALPIGSVEDLIAEAAACGCTSGRERGVSGLVWLAAMLTVFIWRRRPARRMAR